MKVKMSRNDRKKQEKKDEKNREDGEDDNSVSQQKIKIFQKRKKN